MLKILSEWAGRWLTRSLTLAMLIGAAWAAIQAAVIFTGHLITALYQIGLVVYAAGLLAQTLTALRENREVRQ